MVRKLLLCAVLVGVLSKTAEGVTPFRKCTRDIPAPEMVQINDCEQYPCTVRAGSLTNMTIKFTAVNSTENVTAQMVIYVNGDSIPFDLPDDNANACNHLENDVKCPLKAGDSATYNFSIPVDEGLPDINVATELALVDDTGNCIACFVTDVKLQSKPRSSEPTEVPE